MTEPHVTLAGNVIHRRSWERDEVEWPSRECRKPGCPTHDPPRVTRGTASTGQTLATPDRENVEQDAYICYRCFDEGGWADLHGGWEVCPCRG